MTLDDLNRQLEKVIEVYEAEAGKASSYASDEYTENALHASHQATAKALSAFKADIITFLSQQ